MSNETDLTQAYKEAFYNLMMNVATSIPGRIVAFDSDTQLAQVEIGIDQIIVDTAGNETRHTIDPIIEVMVYMPGGNFFVEYQIDPDVEGLIVFSQRCIESWKQDGGPANNPRRRFHNINDALFFPGFRSQGNKISNFQNNGIRLSNKDGSNFIWLKNDGNAEIKVTKLTVTGDAEVTGDVSAKNVTADTEVTAGNIKLTDHGHAGGGLLGNQGNPLGGTSSGSPSTPAGTP